MNSNSLFDNMKKRAHVYIKGRVQGVFFRATTRKKAEDNGVTGWVKNLPDGRVEAVFEGEEEKIEKMIDFCHKGPNSARVEDVEVEWEDYRGNFSGFEVKY